MMDAGKLFVLDSLLSRMKAAGNRVLIYSQMTKMINLLEVPVFMTSHCLLRMSYISQKHLDIVQNYDLTEFF
jgi:hypothetical protein